MCRCISLLLLPTIISLAVDLDRAAAQTTPTICVTGSGAASASPNLVSVRGTLMVSEESVEDTAEKFTEVKDAFTKAIGGDTHPEITLEFAGEKLATGGAGFELAEPPGFGGGPVEFPEGLSQFSVSEEVTLRLKIGSDMEREGITKRLGSLIDAASKAGLQLGSAPNAMFAAMGMSGSSGVAQFELDEESSNALRSRAYTAAFNDARARASALAELSGGQLGKVISVEEAAAPEGGGDLETMQMTMLRRMFGGALGAADGGINHNGQIERTQELVVTFELVKYPASDWIVPSAVVGPFPPFGDR